MIDIKNFVKNAVQELIRTTYPYLLRPSAQVAQIRAVRKETEGRYVYTLQFLDEHLDPNREIPEVPHVLSDMEIQKGELVTAVLLYGVIGQPYIIGRYIG